MTKLLFAFFLSCIFSETLFSQPLEANIIKNNILAKITELDEALVSKDTLTLSNLLHKNVTLGHSNGWIETQESLLQDLSKEYVVYDFFQPIEEADFYYVSNDLVITRRDIDVHGIVSNTSFTVCLNILEIWKFENNRWQLTARQSVNRRE